LDGGLERWEFDLSFSDYLDKHYSKMERTFGELADCFHFYLFEEGVDQADGLSDAEHKKLIRKQLGEFKSVLEDGIL